MTPGSGAAAAAAAGGASGTSGGPALVSSGPTSPIDGATNTSQLHIGSAPVGQSQSNSVGGPTQNYYPNESGKLSF